MDRLAALSTFFIGGFAESERKIRSKVFVIPPQLDDLLSFRMGNFKVMLAPKGVGKTFFLEELNDSALVENKISILIAPKNIKCDNISSKLALSEKINEAYTQILIAIATEVGSRINKKVIIDDSEANLYNIKSESLDRPDLVRRFSKFLTAITPRGKEVAEAFKSLQSVSTNKSTLQKDISKVLKQEDKTFWLLIDDIDQAVVSSESSNNYETCWALIAAAFDISNDFEQIRCIVSVRTDIWHTMTERRKLGSDRLDKMPDRHILHFSDRELQNIFFKRIESAAHMISCREKKNVDCFFDEQVELPSRDRETKQWGSWLSKISRNRPRDLVQAVQILIKRKSKELNKKITSKDANDIMLEFATSRIKNIEKEFQEICPQIRYAIEDISLKQAHEFIDLIEILKKSPSIRSMLLDGQTLKPGDLDGAIELLRVLHMANYINPRVPDHRMPEHYNHKLFDLNPEFTLKANWGTLQQSQWEIHPTFHPYVNELKTVAETKGALWKK